jgi:hypothetical protein
MGEVDKAGGRGQCKGRSGLETVPSKSVNIPRYDIINCNLEVLCLST